jgi:hypothetical protein
VISASARRLLGWPIWYQALLVLLLAGSVRLIGDFVVHWDAVRSGDGLRFALLVGWRCLALVAAGWAFLVAAGRRPGRPAALGSPSPLETVLRAAACILLAAILVTSLTQFAAGLGDDRFAVRAVFRSVLLLAASLWAGRLVVASSAADAPREAASGRLVAVSVSLLLTLLLLEAAALGFGRLYPTRLLWDEHSVRATIAANRFEPGAHYFGFTMNSRGYYDEEFRRAGADDLVVALLADSFGVGIVPYPQNFATVAERQLAASAPVGGRVAVNNYGVAAIGLPEYAWLLENEVPATSPTRVVLALFVGNDISDLEDQRRPGFYSLQQFRLFEVLRRLTLLGRVGGGLGRVAGWGPIGRGPPPNRNGGTFDEETYLEIERGRVEVCNTLSPAVEELYRRAFSWLARIQGQAGDRLVVALIPDDYQVDDALFAALMRRVAEPAAYDRLYPQKRIGSFCRRRGIAVLDLLDPLRRASLRAPVYRPRDSHWNRRGNRVAGEAIARYLIDGTGARRDPADAR